jgi:tRNA dimethylallyltransferase
MSLQNKILIVIAGPTAVGKTKIAIEVAKYFQTEIISADSRQFYNGMTIGTAMPSPEELNTVPHHFINFLPITAHYDAASFEKDAIAKLQDIFTKSNVAVMTGGSGMYIDAVCKGFDVFPAIDPQIRKDLNEKYLSEGLTFLQNAVKEIDPEYLDQVDINNPQRLIRALEVCMGTGKTYSSFRKRKISKRPFRILKIALEKDREKLYQSINNRVDEMIKKGLLEGVRLLLNFENENALQTVGYKEFFSFLKGTCTFEEAIDQIKQNTRRYAKRQLTWLRKDPDYKWLDVSDPDKILNFIISEIEA